MSLTLIQLSDLHLLPPGKALFGSQPAARLDAALDCIARQFADANLLVLTGDLVEDEWVASYQTLRTSLQKLNKPYVLLPGNHDDRALMKRIFPEQVFDANGFMQSWRDVDVGGKTVRLIFMDTQQAGKAYGVYCATRAAWLAQAMLSAPGQQVMLFMHHPPLSVGLASMDTLCLRDTTHLLAAIEEARTQGVTVRHICFGHLHRVIAGAWHGMPFSCVRGTNHQIALDLNPNQAHIPGSLEQPMLAVIQMDVESIVVHFHEFLQAESGFEI